MYQWLEDRPSPRRDTYIQSLSGTVWEELEQHGGGRWRCSGRGKADSSGRQGLHTMLGVPPPQTETLRDEPDVFYVSECEVFWSNVSFIHPNKFTLLERLVPRVGRALLTAPVLFGLCVEVHLCKGVHPSAEPGFKERVKHVGIQHLKQTTEGQLPLRSWPSLCCQSACSGCPAPSPPALASP